MSMKKDAQMGVIMLAGGSTSANFAKDRPARGDEINETNENEPRSLATTNGWSRMWIYIKRRRSHERTPCGRNKWSARGI